MNIAIGNAGADEHSLIAQADAAITPGSKTPILHLFGTAHIPQELQGEYAYLVGCAYADHEIELADMPIQDMEFGVQTMLASLQMSNSVGGRNQETKAKMITGIGHIMKQPGRFARRGNAYDSGVEA